MLRVRAAVDKKKIDKLAYAAMLRARLAIYGEKKMTSWHSCIKNKWPLMRKLTGFWVSLKSKSDHRWETDKFWRLFSPCVIIVRGRVSIPPFSSGQEGVICIFPTGLP